MDTALSIIVVLITLLFFILNKKQANHKNWRPHSTVGLEKVNYKAVDVLSKKKNVPKTGIQKAET
jgi:hypothetical protein